MPENIRRGRNTAIRLGFVEIFCSIAFVEFYEWRRQRIILALIFFTWVATAIGFYAKLKLSYNGLLGHAAYTISVLGGFYIYLIIDFIFGTDGRNKDDGALSDISIMIISSLPMLSLFLMGIYSLCLVLMLEDELDARKKADNGEVDYDYQRVECTNR